ncbi:DUF2946 family protein [Comamonas sp.]|uniref:DUF2946 family protein n=1 Tax=Comamonas sp. TaxID=34028 RepID=UPI003FA5D73F
MLALIWGWLAAPLAQAIGGAGGSWVQVCTSLGTRFVQLDDGGLASDDGKPAPSASPSAECPYCRLHGSVALLPVVVQMPVVFRPSHVLALVPVTTIELPDPPWQPALPRGPPPTISA